MHHDVATYLSAWENFYIIVGSSAGALTGLQFVVIALVAEVRPRNQSGEISAFGTPTVVHFCAVLLLGAILSAPWGALSNVAFALGACGLAGLIYCGIVVKRARLQKGYEPMTEDWIFHAVLPILSYAGVLIAAIAFLRGPASALFVVAAAALILLFIGIHNSWDTVTYIAVRGWEVPTVPAPSGGGSPDPAPRD